jgi:pimeloyl-ACP methyl ester carboxylesterase
MLRAGYSTFAWDKPGTGESTGRIDRSRLGEQRAQFVLDAIDVLKSRPDIDPDRIGLWGISQAGYVMPRVIAKSNDISFMIAISCPGEAGIDQGAYLFTAQAVCAGLPEEDAERVEQLVTAASRAQTYEEYARNKAPLADYPVIRDMTILGFKIGVTPEDKWHADDPAGEYYWDPMEIIETIKIPVLAVFGASDTQADPIQGAEAYRVALARGGHPHSRVELIPGVDHNIIVTETGCMEERNKRSREGWTRYAPEYLDLLEDWLKGL